MSASLAGTLWWFLTYSVVLFYFLVFYIFPKSEFISRLYLMGKLRKKETKSSFLSMFDVPKSWFSHYYILAIVVNTTLLVVVTWVIVYETAFPAWLQDVLTFLHSPQTEPDGVPATAVLLVLLMEEIQVIRRCYECLYISVYSDSRISVVHYGMGLLLYLTFGCCILSSSDYSHFQLTDGLDQVCAVSACLLFVAASVWQHRCHRILAKLRKDRSGNVENKRHLLPFGGLFELVSCPHFLCEILVYFAMNLVVQFRHEACLAIGVFVLVNQVIMSLITHSWYKRKFPRYPKHRTAVFPYFL